jgi:hypothetical protein
VTRHKLVMRVGLAALAVLVGCSGSDPSARVDANVLPRGDAFRPVAQVFVDSCGSIDCHGSKYRNMRLFGFGSERLDPTMEPDAQDTTSPEVDEDYNAVVSVEPEVTRAVAQDHGHDPERLTFLRKGRGAEAHKGGTRLIVGGPADNCVLSWLAGSVDGATCRAAVPRLASP